MSKKEIQNLMKLLFVRCDDEIYHCFAVNSDELRKIYETIVLRSINGFIPKK